VDKVVIIGESNNAEVWGRSPQPPEENGGGASDAEAIFYSFFQKNAHF